MSVAVFVARFRACAATFLGNVLEKIPIFWEFLLKKPPTEIAYSCQKRHPERVLLVYSSVYTCRQCMRTATALITVDRGIATAQVTVDCGLHCAFVTVDRGTATVV
ncbi:MAG: hypothetical protein ACYTXF_37050 [Nostoc sp.]